MRSRYEIILENYCKTIRIEAATMVDMVYKHFLPAITAFAKEVAEAGNAKKALFDGIDLSYELETVKKLSSLTAAISRSVRELEEELDRADTITDVTNQAFTFKDKVITKMAELRSAVDEAEHITSAKNWPFPNYSELLFGVR
jgi:glutamine synthetase